MFGIVAESPASGARFVGKNWGKHDTPPKNQNPDFQWLDFTRDIIFYKPNFVFENETDLPKRQSQELAKTYAEKLTLRKIYFARKNEPGKKA